jgi:hypothetical protein
VWLKLHLDGINMRGVRSRSLNIKLRTQIRYMRRKGLSRREMEQIIGHRLERKAILYVMQNNYKPKDDIEKGARVTLQVVCT